MVIIFLKKGEKRVEAEGTNQLKWILIFCKFAENFKKDEIHSRTFASLFEARYFLSRKFWAKAQLVPYLYINVGPWLSSFCFPSFYQLPDHFLLAVLLSLYHSSTFFCISFYFCFSFVLKPHLLPSLLASTITSF